MKLLVYQRTITGMEFCKTHHRKYTKRPRLGLWNRLFNPYDYDYEDSDTFLSRVISLAEQIERGMYPDVYIVQPWYGDDVVWYKTIWLNGKTVNKED